MPLNNGSSDDDRAVEMVSFLHSGDNDMNDGFHHSSSNGNGHLDKETGITTALASSSTISSASAPSKSDPHGGAPGTATNTQVAVNIFISFVGAGMLGMPDAFKRSGWVLGSIVLSLASNVYAMLLLVACRKHLEARGITDITGYGDVGRVVLGRRGEIFVNACLVISQVGFATAYIIFIAANLYSIAQIPRLYVCFGCVPVLAILVQAKEMKTLSPFSLLADVANLAGLASVLLFDFKFGSHDDPIQMVEWSNIITVAAISIYSLEGIGLILSLESSAADREGFPNLLKVVIAGITVLMAVFGTAGYHGFGENTEAPITLNLEGTWATFVKLSLCLALYLTYPIMMFPVGSLIEEMVVRSDDGKPHRLLRFLIVLGTAGVAYAIPNFRKFLSLVGSSICTILGFILPCIFHLRVFGEDVKWWQWFLDYLLIIGGIMFGAIGTYTSFLALLSDDDEAGLGGER